MNTSFFLLFPLNALAFLTKRWWVFSWALVARTHVILSGSSERKSKANLKFVNIRRWVLFSFIYFQAVNLITFGFSGFYFLTFPNVTFHGKHLYFDQLSFVIFIQFLFPFVFLQFFLLILLLVFFVSSYLLYCIYVFFLSKKIYFNIHFLSFFIVFLHSLLLSFPFPYFIFFLFYFLSFRVSYFLTFFRSF